MTLHKPWVRLAQANVILGQCENACRVLISAAEYEPEEWEIWRDLTAVSDKCSHFEKVATAYYNAVGLNPRYENADALKNLVASLNNEKMDKNAHSRIRIAACKLLHHLTQTFPHNTHYWPYLGVVIASDREPNDFTRKKAVETLSKSIEIIKAPFNKWYNHDSSTFPVVLASQLIVDCLVCSAYHLRGTKEGADCQGIALNFITYITTNLEDYHSDFLTRSVRQIFLNHYNLLQDKYLRIKEFKYWY